MPWTIELSEQAKNALVKLDKVTRKRILRFLRERLDGCTNPRVLGESLTGRYAGLWKYRVGHYRLVCQLQDARLVVLVVNIGHRSTIYRDRS